MKLVQSHGLPFGLFLALFRAISYKYDSVYDIERGYFCYSPVSVAVVDIFTSFVQ